MEDQKIIALYHNRDESAITETDRKYGVYCRTIAMNILSVREDAEECVNDTWHIAWIRMPPEVPHSLRACHCFQAEPERLPLRVFFSL